MKQQDGEEPKIKTVDVALGYIRIGWWVLPLEPRSKKPLAKLVPNGVHGATNDPSVAIDWWTRYPDANIGIAVKPSGLVVIDIDPRNGGFETMERLEAQHGRLLSDVSAFTGGGGEHGVFLSQDTANLPGKLGPGVDLKSDGYICGYPSIHPSGKRYEWEASSDPLEGVVPSMLPSWVRDLSRGPAPVVASAAWSAAVAGHGAATQRAISITPEQQAEIGQALTAIPADSRDVWLQVGMALQSTGAQQWAYDTWCAWSQQSDKFDQQDQIRVWRSFAAQGLDGITYRTIFELAKQGGLVVAPSALALPAPIELPEPADDAPVAEELPEPAPAHLLRPPGVLGVACDWINATAHKAQPMFAVQAALAWGCTVLGRRFVTTTDNWPSLFFLNVGKSASGKEHAKTAVERLLEHCGMEGLIGPAGYTSDSGLLSTLGRQPSHIAIVDEFGRVLESASVRGNTRAQTTMRALMEVWGRCGGVIRPAGYSTFGLSKAEAQRTEDRSVRNPALTLLALTTPEFWETVGSAAVRDGFLNRFLIVESDIGRQVGEMVQRTAPPEVLATWARAMHADTEGALGQTGNATLEPAAQVVQIDQAAQALFRAFAAECIALMDTHEQDGLAEMFGRSAEMAMRIALVCAVARCAEAAQVRVAVQDAQWGIDYVRFHSTRTAKRLAQTLFDSEFEGVKLAVMQVIRKARSKGATQAEIDRGCRKYRALDDRQQKMLLQSLAAVEEAVRVTFQPHSGRGKPREAWVATEHMPKEAESD